MCYSVQEGASIRLRRRWETTWIRFVAVSSTFLGAGRVPSVYTVRESRAWHRLQLGAGREPNISFCPWHRGGIRGGPGR